MKFVTSHFHRVLVVARPVKPLFEFPKSIIAAGVSRKRSRVALFEDPRFLFLGDNDESSKHYNHQNHIDREELRLNCEQLKSRNRTFSENVRMIWTNNLTSEY